MRARANTRWIVAATLSLGLLLVLAAAIGLRKCSRGESVTAPLATEREGVTELDAVSSAADSRRDAQATPGAPGFVPEPVFGDHLTIIAVDADGDPVPGAVIQVFEPLQRGWDLDEPLTAFERDPLNETRRHGQPFTCDESGRARIPRVQRRAALLGSHETLAGFDSIGPGESSPYFLELARQNVLDVRVRDEAGAPVAGLALEVHEHDGDSLWRGVTDAGGCSTIDSLAFGIHWPDEVVILTAGVPVDPPVERWLPGDLASPNVVEFVVPNGATTTVRIVDHRGRLLDLTGELTVYIPGTEPRTTAETRHVIVPLRNGSAVIRGIPASCTLLYLSHSMVSDEIAPLPSGLWPPTIDVVRDERYEIVRFAARDAAGKTLGARRIDWGQADVEDGRLDSDIDGQVVTDAHGEFSLFVYFDDSEEGPRPSVIEVFDHGVRPPLRGAIDVSLLRSSRLREPVELVLAPLPLALGGRVLDELGKPVAGAEVDARTIQGEDSDDLWTSADVYTDANGRFEMHALPTDDALGVYVLVDNRHVGGDGLGTEYAFGSNGIELRASLSPVIEGRLLLDARDRDRDIDITAWRNGAEDGWFESWSEPEGIRWHVVRLEPGTYSLRVTVDDVLVRTIDDVHVPKSGTVHDPRCIPIDLRGSVPAAADPGDTSELIRTLRVVDGRGVPIEHGIWRFESSGHWASWRPWLGGEVIVLAPFTRIEVWSPGYALREGAPPAGAATWELKPAPTIELVFELPPELHTRDVRLRAQAELSWDETRRLDWMLRGYEPVTDIDPSGRARFRFPAGREWLIEVHAAWGAGESAEGAELQQFRIQPDDAPAGEPLRLKPDAAKWLEILRDKGAPILPSRE